MKIRSLKVIGFLIFVLIFCNGRLNAEKPKETVKIFSSDINDQRGVALTVYNANLGLVKEIREIKLEKGRSELRFMDVASGIIPTSVHIKSLIKTESLNVLEQNYEYDLLNPEKLLDKYIGKKVKLYTQNPYSERETVIEATVLSNNNGVAVFKMGDEITYNYPGRIIFPGVPDDLISKPTLVWLLENDLASEQKIEASYLTNGINWKADYVLTLNDKDDLADLAGWVTIDNKSGAIYRDAKLKLVAGDIQRVRDEEEYREKMVYAAKAMAEEAQFKEEGFFEYHIYTLQRPSTIKNNQTKQISLITADNIRIDKELVYQGLQNYFSSRYGEQLSDQKVGVFINFQNKKENNLGIPLPRGVVRVYKEDTEGSLQFAGEDTIDHTPKDEKIRIKVGDAFDVVGTRKQIKWEKIASDSYETEYEISLRNHKKEDVVVKVIEPIPGDWKILNSSHEYTKTDSSTAEFNIPVPRDKEVKLKYSVRVRF